MFPFAAMENTKICPTREGHGVCLYANVRTEKVDEFTKIMSAMSSKEL
jgi:hypothetical protein